MSGTSASPTDCARCGKGINGGTWLGNDGPYCGYCMAQLPDADLRTRAERAERERDELRAQLDGYLRVGAPNLTTELGAMKRERDEAHSLLASLADCVNTFAREDSVAESPGYLTAHEIRDAVERVVFKNRRERETLRGERDAAKAEAARLDTQYRRLHSQMASMGGEIDRYRAALERIRCYCRKANELEVNPDSLTILETVRKALDGGTDGR